MSRPQHAVSFHKQPPMVILECNTDIVAGADVEFDTFYDRAFDDLLGVLPATMGLSTADGITFTADEALMLAIDINIAPNATPGNAGWVSLSTSGYLYPPKLFLAAALNPTDLFIAQLVLPMAIGDELAVATSGTALDVLAVYAALQIVRLA